MAATTASLIAESVGALLRQAREEAGFDVREVAQGTKIPERYIALFESDAHGELADDVYTKIYLKAYGKFLGFETSALLEHYRKERGRYGIPAQAEERPDRHPTASVASSLLMVTPKLVSTMLLVFMATGLLGWLGLELKKIIAAPSIALASPKDGFVTYDRAVSIEGITEKEVSLSINGKLVSPDDAGHFQDTLELQEGLNIISITGSKKHSKEMAVTRRVIVLPKATAVAPPTDLQIEEVLPAGVTPARATITPVPTKTEVVDTGAMQAATIPGETTAPVTPEPVPETPPPTTTTETSQPAAIAPAETTPTETPAQ